MVLAPYFFNVKNPLSIKRLNASAKKFFSFILDLNAMSESLWEIFSESYSDSSNHKHGASALLASCERMNSTSSSSTSSSRLRCSVIHGGRRRSLYAALIEQLDHVAVPEPPESQDREHTPWLAGPRRFPLA